MRLLTWTVVLLLGLNTTAFAASKPATKPTATPSVPAAPVDKKDKVERPKPQRSTQPPAPLVFSKKP